MRRQLVAPLAALLLSTAVPALAWDGDAEPQMTVKVRDASGEGMTLSLGGNWLARLGAAIADESMHCNGADTSAEMRRALERLDRGGEGTRETFTDDDGDRVRVRRYRGQLELNVKESDGDKADVTLPWAAAECMLGRPVKLHDMLGHDGLVLHVDDHEGGEVKVEVQ